MRRLRVVTNPEEGAVAVTTAVLLVSLVLLSAFVVDLGLLRMDHRTNQSVADMSVTAGARALGSDLNRVDACREAWAYLVNNLRNVLDTEPDPGCAAAFSGPCDSATPPQDLPATLPDGLEVIIRMPVPNNDPAMQPGRQAYVSTIDGEPCERLAVYLRQGRSHNFAPVGGFTQGSSLSTAVGRRTDEGTESEYATLIILRAQDCESLQAGGGNGVIVFNHDDGAGNVSPGVITADSVSAGSCASNKTVYNSAGTGYLCAGVTVDVGTHETAALDIDDNAQCHQGGSGPNLSETSILPDTIRTVAEDPTHWITEGSPGSIEPDVTAGSRTSRKIVDHAYNCDTHNYLGSGNYPPFSVATPQYPVSGPNEPEVSDCTTRSVPAIDLVVNAFVNNAAHSGFTPAGCAGSTATHVYIDCTSGPGHMALPNAEIVVVDRLGGPQPGIKLSSGNSLTIGAAGGNDAMMIVRDGGVSVQGGSLFLHNTMTYVHAADALFDVTSDDPQTFTAPQDVGWNDDTTPHTAVDCTTSTIGGHPVPDTSCFQNLALWDNGDRKHKLAGGAALTVRGVFFFPRGGRHNGAGFEMAGGNASGAGLDMRDAQLFTWRLSASGQKPLLMRPDPDVFLETPKFGVGLIR